MGADTNGAGGGQASGPSSPWEGGWQEHRRWQVEAWSSTTPAQRLAWLEEAITFAHRAGALPRAQHDGGGMTEAGR
ncbi:MAG: hypothetical protein M3N52_01080 [Actinomycetota bacterium]|nr:hypothetical protein [Actinomycetota bacterium]